jgi:hypothetical protein
MKRVDRFKNILKNSGLVIAKEGNTSLNLGKDPYTVALQAAINSGSEAVLDNWRITEISPGQFMMEGNIRNDEKGRFPEGNFGNTTRVEFVQTLNTAYKLGERGYETHYEVIDPDGMIAGNMVWWPKEPDPDLVSGLCALFLGEGVTLARVPALVSGAEYEMLVDEDAGLKDLAVNRNASKFHSAFYMSKDPELTEKDIVPLKGPAVLFRRKVWF